MTMSKWERVRAAMIGAEVDRPPFGLWRHFYDSEDSFESHYRAMADWQRDYDFDFLKVNPRAHYHVEGWGVVFDYDGSGAKPVRRRYPVSTASDLKAIRPLALDSPALAEQLAVLRRLGEDFAGTVPYIETLFSPLSIIADLCESDEALVGFLAEDPASVHAALEAVVITFQPFARACLAAGASGIFYATTTWATSDRIPHDVYQTFGRPYDERMLASFADAPFNVLHICQNNSFVRELADLGPPVVNWAVGEPGNPTLAELASRHPGKAVMGGLSDEALTSSSTDLARAEIARGLQETGGRHWFLAGECSIPTDSRGTDIRAALAALGA